MIIQKVEDLLFDHNVSNGLAELLVLIVSILSFMIVECFIYRYSKTITTPIEQLTKHTQDYREAKTRKDKKDVIEEFKEDAMFKRIQNINEREELKEELTSIELNK